MRAATSAWDSPSSRRSVISCPDTECRRSAISRNPGKDGGMAALAHDGTHYLTFDIT